MKMNYRILAMLTMATFTIFTSCKKDDKPVNNPPDLSTEITTHSDDQNRVSSETDAVADDAGSFLEADAAFSGRMQDAQEITSICGASAVLDTLSNPRTITITYNGLDCSGARFRTGVIVLSMASNTRWKNPGAAINVNFQNYKVKRLSDNKSITINGNQTYTNVTGGLLYQLSNLTNIIHTISSNNMSITFDDNSQRVWQIGRKRTYTYNNGIVLEVNGTHTIGNNNQVTEWGLNRFGHPFTTSITQGLVVKQSCAFRLTSGSIKHEGFALSTVTFGLDSTGNPTGCPGASPFYYKVTWTGPNGASAMAIIPY